MNEQCRQHFDYGKKVSEEAEYNFALLQIFFSSSRSHHINIYFYYYIYSGLCFPSTYFDSYYTFCDVTQTYR